jgi:hypothetical protein
VAEREGAGSSRSGGAEVRYTGNSGMSYGDLDVLDDEMGEWYRVQQSQTYYLINYFLCSITSNSIWCNLGYPYKKRKCSGRRNGGKYTYPHSSLSMSGSVRRSEHLCARMCM